jgi:hypothetical protein
MGKSTQMVEFVKADPKRILLTFSAARKKQLCDEFDIPKERVFTWQDMKKNFGMYGREIKVCIDDLDMVINQALECPQHIEAVTMTAEYVESLTKNQGAGE